MMLTMGSLFDGISAFPRSASKYEIETKWISEIEPFPVRTSAKHFPKATQLGDVTKINGANIQPVDIITFGSPCQDLSVAGKQKGLEGERSGLFLEAVRIIGEMRNATNGVYPTFAIWENVPGAFSSNSGGDFRTVLEALTETEIPMPNSGKWAEAGMVRGNGREIAWRVLDAQFWGVPQRRKRIFLVADFRGQRAGEILFEREGLSGDITESREAWEEVATSVGDGSETAGCLTPWDAQSKRIHPEDGKWPALYSGEGGGGAHGYVFREPSRINCQPDGISETVSSKWSKGTGGPAGDEHYNLVCQPLMVENHPADSRVKIDETGTTQTLTSRMGTGGGNVPMLMQPIAFDGYNQTLNEKAQTIRAEKSDGDHVGMILEPIPQQKAYSFDSLASNSMKSKNPNSGCREVDKSKCLDTTYPDPSKNQGGIAILEPIPINDKATRYKGGGASRNHDGSGNGLGVGKPGDPCPTLTAGDRHAIAQPIAFNGRQSHISPWVIAGTLDTGHPQAQCIAYPNPANTLLAKGNFSYRLDQDNVAIHAVDVRNLRETEELSGTLQSKENGGYSLNYQNPVRIGYRVRRLTPVECLRLMGFPDWWLDIEGASDSAKYKAIGNSIAIPPLDFIFGQIIALFKKVDKCQKKTEMDI